MDLLNQDKLKVLLDNYSSDKDFKVVFTGKESKNVDGIYENKTSKIFINDRNFSSNDEIIYTALHQLTHHIEYTNKPKSLKSFTHIHNKDFNKLFFSLIVKAIDNEDFKPLNTPLIRATINSCHALTRISKDLGRALIECKEECLKAGYPFEDLTTRVLYMEDIKVKEVLSMAAYDVPIDIPVELARNIVKLKKPEEVEEAINKKAMPKAKPPADPVDEETRLRQEKERILKKIDKDNQELSRVDELLQGFEDSRAVNGQ